MPQRRTMCWSHRGHEGCLQTKLWPWSYIKTFRQVELREQSNSALAEVWPCASGFGVCTGIAKRLIYSRVPGDIWYLRNPILLEVSWFLEGDIVHYCLQNTGHSLRWIVRCKGYVYLLNSLYLQCLWHKRHKNFRLFRYLINLWVFIECHKEKCQNLSGF